MKSIKTIIALILLIAMQSCTNPAGNHAGTIEAPKLKHPEWSKNAVIYEVNIRQYTHEGTFNAFSQHLDRLHDMGVDILWLMPINPIGKENRKGTLGSYYSIADYNAVNPEFGTMDDFKNLVAKAHSLGMKVILDWVANHCSWDNVWTKTNPEWIQKDSTGKFLSPYDWTDVIELDYANPEMRKAMISSMKFWLTEADVDGYRCDVAGMVPVDFWNELRPALDSVKPVFMLAESEEPQHHEIAFDMTYSWDLHHLMNDIAQGKKTADELMLLYAKEDTLFGPDDYRMLFTSNHDENSWNGTEFERMGSAAPTFAVLAGTLPGMLLVYSGQEAGLGKRLKFFEKDEINWDKLPYQNFYKRLIALKTDHEPLWNGSFGGEFTILTSTSPKEVFAFSRVKGEKAVVVITNLSKNPVSAKVNLEAVKGEYTNYVDQSAMTLSGDVSFDLKPWEYLIFTK